MKVTQQILSVLFLFSILISCSSSDSDETTDPKTDQAGLDEASLQDSERDDYINEIDAAELYFVNSLFYSKSDNTSERVKVFVNDSSEVVKILQEYTRANSGAIESNQFYYKDGNMYASKAIYASGDDMNHEFVEDVTYYKDGKPEITKQRKAAYEEELDYEMFSIVKSKAHSDVRAYQVFNREGEFNTTFQGIVRAEHLIYLIVGEDKDDGFTSPLVVQKMTPLIQTLINDEKQLLGTPLKVEFTAETDPQGVPFQALITCDLVQEANKVAPEKKAPQTK
jgi:hypothetical protein